MPGRARVYSTEGVILRRRNIGEADSIFTVYAAREGKFDAVAKGVRKARSHMRGHLEPLTRTRMQLARGRSLDVFTQAETLTPYRAIREDLERGAAAMYCAELVDRFTIEHAENPGLYGLLLDTLDAIEAGAGLPVVRFFELGILTITGYEIQLDACAICHARLPEAEALLAPGAGGLVCIDCRVKAGQGRLISVRAIKVLRFARSGDLSRFAGLRIDDELARELQLALAEVIRFTLERETNSSRYVEAVARLGAARPLTEGHVQ